MSDAVQGEGVPGPPAGGPGGAAGRPPEGEGGPGGLLDRRFRANPRYELVLFDRLAPAERRALARLREQPGFYGVLRAAGGGTDGTALSAKSVDRDTALLLLTLRDPGPLPSYLAEVLGPARHRTMARLVADGVLEVESGGGFHSGPAALALLPGGLGEEAGEGAAGAGDRADSGLQGGERPQAGPLAELSLAALRWAARLPFADPMVLAARLYAYNRRPLTPAWARRLAGPEAVRKFLGLAPGSPAAAALGAWFPVPARGTWLLWGVRDAPPRADAGPTFKLYLSPQPEALPAVLAAALAVLPGAGAGRLKVGGDAAGLLRPDKLVAYFGDLDRLAAAAEGLAERLAGAPAQGVPFTAEVAGGGLLSWGAEPPRSRLLPGGRESWRLYLANRLGAALAEARAAEEKEPWRFALERLRLDGIDTETWAPRALFWAEVR